MDKERKKRRDRLVALSFVAVLLLLVYGPGARWFVAADRVLYDQIAASIGNTPLEHGVIVSIDPDKVAAENLDAVYGSLIEVLKRQDVQRIVLPHPPPIEAGAELPGWAATLSTGAPVFVPRGHRLDRVATWSGFLQLQPDSDAVLRRSSLWQFEGGVMFPSLALAIALQNPRFASDANAPIPGADAAVYLSSYAELPRLSPDEVLDPALPSKYLAGHTVFVDAEPPLEAAAAKLPSGQYVTRSEVTAALLASIEQDQAITAPVWIVALQWLAPLLLAAGAAWLLPGRSRRDVIVLALAAILGLVFLEVLLLAFGRVRLDLGRPAFIFASVAILCWWFATTGKKAAVHAFKRGTDFLAAGRLEPAFAEFRRCEPSESLASVMYKLSLAFEEQAKPERAEAVIQWMKRTQNPQKETKFSLSDTNGGVPHRLGRYVIEKRIGRGAMGAVYLARDPRINRPVALKVIPIEKEFEDEELEEARLRFFREAESAGRLTHPNIITVYDCGEDKGLAYIAMEYLPGLQLTHFTNPAKLLAPKRTLELCARTAEALDYAHNQQVIHRDIKPANLLYDNRADILKISDFGVARLTDNNRTKTGIVLGTPMYMSPEQLAAEDLTGLSDLFSLGVTLYELLVGEVPFKATNIAVLMTKITSEDPVPVSNRRAGIPPGVDAVLSKALAKRPEHRFANGGEMAIALRNCARYA